MVIFWNKHRFNIQILDIIPDRLGWRGFLPHNTSGRVQWLNELEEIERWHNLVTWPFCLALSYAAISPLCAVAWWWPVTSLLIIPADFFIHSSCTSHVIQHNNVVYHTSSDGWIVNPLGDCSFPLGRTEITRMKDTPLWLPLWVQVPWRQPNSIDVERCSCE